MNSNIPFCEVAAPITQSLKKTLPSVKVTVIVRVVIRLSWVDFPYRRCLAAAGEHLTEKRGPISFAKLDTRKNQIRFKPTQTGGPKTRADLGPRREICEV